MICLRPLPVSPPLPQSSNSEITQPTRLSFSPIMSLKACMSFQGQRPVSPCLHDQAEWLAHNKNSETICLNKTTKFAFLCFKEVALSKVAMQTSATACRAWHVIVFEYYLVNDWIFCCCCSVAKSCLTLCDPMDYGTPGFSVPHYFLEFAQIHVH